MKRSATIYLSQCGNSTPGAPALSLCDGLGFLGGLAKGRPHLRLRMENLGAASADQAAFTRKLFAPLPLPSELYVTPRAFSASEMALFSSRSAFCRSFRW